MCIEPIGVYDMEYPSFFIILHEVVLHESITIVIEGFPHKNLKRVRSMRCSRYFSQRGVGWGLPNSNHALIQKRKSLQFYLPNCQPEENRKRFNRMGHSSVMFCINSLNKADMLIHMAARYQIADILEKLWSEFTYIIIDLVPNKLKRTWSNDNHGR